MGSGLTQEKQIGKSSQNKGFAFINFALAFQCMWRHQVNVRVYYNLSVLSTSVMNLKKNWIGIRVDGVSSIQFLFLFSNFATALNTYRSESRDFMLLLGFHMSPIAVVKLQPLAAPQGIDLTARPNLRLS